MKQVYLAVAMVVALSCGVTPFNGQSPTITITIGIASEGFQAAASKGARTPGDALATASGSFHTL